MHVATLATCHEDVSAMKAPPMRFARAGALADESFGGP